MGVPEFLVSPLNRMLNWLLEFVFVRLPSLFGASVTVSYKMHMYTHTHTHTEDQHRVQVSITCLVPDFLIIKCVWKATNL